MPSDYGYINARLKGQHSRLLKPGAYEELLNLSDFPAVTKWLVSSPYAKEWQEAQARHSGLAAAEEALSMNFNSSASLMRKISEGRPQKLIGILLRRWDLENVKAVIRGIHNRWEEEEIVRAVLPAGSLDRVKLMELCRKNDLRELTDTLATWNDEFSVPLTKALPVYQQDHDLVGLDLVLDKFYYYQALKQLSGLDRNRSVVREILRREIDLLNAKSLRRMMTRKETGLDEIAKYYLPGGRILTMDKYTSLLDPKESKKVLRSLRGTSFYRMLANGSSGEEEVIEHQEWGNRAMSYRQDPLGIEVAVGFLWQKYFEVVNLRLVVRGKYFGLPADSIREQFLMF
jgi:V/A-type H+-transporting ATPase subunit C